VKLLAPQQIADQLHDRFTWLQSSDRTAQPRHRTLAALVAWSYDLLPPAEQALLQGLSIFASRFSLATAEAVLGAWLAARQAPLVAPLVEVLARLVDKSLVGVEGQTGPVAHYRLLETIRQFGAERLAEAGDTQAVGQRCLVYYTAWTEAAEAGLVGPDAATWLAKLASEHDNLRGALAWAQAHGAPEAGLRLASALWLFWHQHGHWREGSRWLEGFLSAATGSAPEERAKASDGLGVLLWRLGDAAQAGHAFDAALALLRPQGNTTGLSRVLAHQGLLLDGLGDNAGARQAYTESLAISRALGDKPGIARALHNLGNLAVMQDKSDEALGYYEECLALYREWNDHSGIALLSLGLGTIAQEQGDWARARAMFVQSRDLARQVGDQYCEAMAIWGLGKTALEESEATQAAELLQDSLVRFEALGNVDGVAASQTALGRARQAQGDLAGAADLLHTGLRGHQAVGNLTGVAEGLEALGALAAAMGQPERAVRLLAAGAQMRVTLQRPLPPLEAAALDAIHDGLRTRMGAAAFQTAWTMGEGLSREAALAEGLAVSGRP
jgi:tetratricopeptide (TPR) repeat protein